MLSGIDAAWCALSPNGYVNVVQIKDKIMNILFYCLSDNPTLDGVSRVTNMLATELSKQGISVFLCCWFTSDRITDVTYKDILYEKGDSDEGIQRILSFIRTYHIDIFINSFTANVEIYPLLKALKTHSPVKLITVLHTSPIWYEGIKTFYRNFNCPDWIKQYAFMIYKNVYMRPRLKRLTARIYKLSDVYVLLSEHFVEEFLNYNKSCDDSKLVVINNPTPYANLVPQKKEKIMLYVGRLENIPKRIDRILAIWKSFHHKSDGWQLKIVGEGRDREKLESMAESMHITDVSFEGHVDDVDLIYNRAKLLLVTSDSEGWAMTIVEGMRLGVVPIAYNTFSSLQDTIVNGVNGFVVTPDNVSEFVHCIYESEANFDSMSNAARTMSTHFLIDKIAKQWIILFEQLS